MSIFSSIVSAIFGHANATPAAGGGSSSGNAPKADAAPSSSQASPGQASAGQASTQTAQAGSPAGKQLSNVDVGAVLDGLAAKNKEKLDWKHSIVDLMKLLDLDSGLSARKELANELHYTGDTNDSAKMNVWLHEQVIKKLAENGGKVPADLKH